MTVRRQFRAVAAECAAARAFVAGQARAAHLPGALVADLELAASELATNTITHRPQRRDGRFGVEFGVNGHAVVVTVLDHAPQPVGPVQLDRPMPGTGAEGGRGLALLAGLGATLDLTPGGVAASFDLADYGTKATQV